jgi:hypothetical protein
MTWAISRRDGLFSLQRAARELCRLVTAFTPVITRLYPTNTALLAALAAANTACAVLEAEVTAQKEPGV